MAYQKLHDEHSNHPMVAAASYIYAKSLIRLQQFKSAQSVLQTVEPQSDIYESARFLEALCNIWQNKTPLGIRQLDSLAGRTDKKSLQDECHLTLGLLYHQNRQEDSALIYLDRVPASSSQYDLATLKKAMVHLGRSNYNKAIEAARPALNNNRYFYEVCMVLIDAYYGLRDSTNAIIVRNRLSLHARLTRLLSLAQEERLLLNDLERHSLQILNDAQQADSAAYSREIKNNHDIITKRVEENLKNLEQISNTLTGFSSLDEPVAVRGILEKKFMERTEIDLTLINTKIQKLRAGIKARSQASPGGPFEPVMTSAQRSGLDSLFTRQEQLQRLLGDLRGLYQSQVTADEASLYIQPKYIDVGMILYERLKEKFQKANQQIREYNARRDKFLATQGKGK